LVSRTILGGPGSFDDVAVAVSTNFDINISDQWVLVALVPGGGIAAMIHIASLTTLNSLIARDGQDWRGGIDNSDGLDGRSLVTSAVGCSPSSLDSKGSVAVARGLTINVSNHWVRIAVIRSSRSSSSSWSVITATFNNLVSRGSYSWGASVNDVNSLTLRHSVAAAVGCSPGSFDGILSSAVGIDLLVTVSDYRIRITIVRGVCDTASGKVVNIRAFNSDVRGDVKA